METKINIAEILKNKPQGTKLYDLLRNIDVYLDEVHITDIGSYIECTANNEVGSTMLFDYSELGTEVSWLDGLQILKPSKYMHDWSKFAWKKGDLLVNSCGFQCIFKEWKSDDYTKFNGCYSNSRDGYEDVSNAETAKFDKLDHNIAYGYVREIERKLGGKLNLGTLEIEKSQTQFKDGDVITIMPRMGDKLIYLFKSEDDEKYYGHAFLDGNIAIVNEDSYCQKDYCTARLSTEEEQQQLFDALAKDGKAWDAEKKMIVDLKSLWTPKPFDKVLVRNSDADKWLAGFFEKFEKSWNNPYHIMNLHHMTDFAFKQCIPYEGNESLLGTTKDVEGEQ